MDAPGGTSKPLHALLRRQLRRCGVADPSAVPDAATWACVLERVSRSYEQNDQDRYTLERSLNISSGEMQDLHESLREAHSRELSDARRFEAVVSSLGDAVCILDDRARLTFANPAALELLGCELHELLGEPLLDRLRLDDGVSGTALFERTLEESAIRCPEAHVVGCRKDPVPVSVALNPIRDEHGVRGAVLALRDITESVRARQELERARDRAEDASRAKSDFLATMSHELRTPLNGVVGTIALLRDTDLSALQREYAESAYDSSQALLSILDDLLDFSKIEAGRLDLEHVDFELDTVVDEAADLFLDAAHAKGLEFDVLYSRNAPRRVRGDPGRVRQLLINLLGNALKFTRRGGVRVEVRLECTHDTGSVVRIEVHDTGIGIPVDRQDRVFSAFAQADGSMARKFGGAGLGLAIARRLAWAMGGDIGVTSSPGKGSCFWFTLDLARAPQRSRDDNPFAALDVVLLDDADTPRRTLAERFHALGAQVLPARDHAQALARLRASRAVRRLLVLPLSDQDAPLLDELTADPALAGVRTLATDAGDRLPLDALSRAPRFGAFLRLPARSHALRRILARFDAAHAVRLVEAGERPTGEGDHPTRRARILVVEDSPVNQLVARRMLEALGHRVCVAANGIEALAVLHREPVDLVFMDCQMPEMDGFEATRRVRDDERDGTHVPIVAMTANAVKGDRERCLESGMDDYLSKPVRPDDLRGMLAKWLAAGAPA